MRSASTILSKLKISEFYKNIIINSKKTGSSSWWNDFSDDDTNVPFSILKSMISIPSILSNSNVNHPFDPSVVSISHKYLPTGPTNCIFHSRGKQYLYSVCPWWLYGANNNSPDIHSILLKNAGQPLNTHFSQNGSNSDPNVYPYYQPTIISFIIPNTVFFDTRIHIGRINYNYNVVNVNRISNFEESVCPNSVQITKSNFLVPFSIIRCSQIKADDNKYYAHIICEYFPKTGINVTDPWIKIIGNKLTDDVFIWNGIVKPYITEPSLTDIN